MDGHRTWLILLLMAFVMAINVAVTLADNQNTINDRENKNGDDDLPMIANPKFNKMLPSDPTKVKVIKKSNLDSISKEQILKLVNSAAASGERKETTRLPLAEDPRFNKMLPQKNMLRDESTESTKSKDDNDEYYDDYYDDYDNYNDDSKENGTSSKGTRKNSTNPTKNAKVTKTTVTTSKPEIIKTKEQKIPDFAGKGKLKPIRGDDKTEPGSDEATDDLDDDDDDDEDGNIDDIPEDEEIVYNENVPCPRDCICNRNVNSYLVATCSRLDAEVQKFGSDITDLIVTDVGPKYPILLGPEFFKKIGLKHVSSIKISNCTIEYIHPTAFNGLDDLYSVNLTNVGLTVINPDTFVDNKRLRLLTISGNNLSDITRKGSRNAKYLLKSQSIEEIDLSNNNLEELPSTAFSELNNIVYINLAQNNLRNLPADIFDNVETIEELDLSYNSLKTLPENIFNRTALAILHLKYNDISNDLRFGTSDLQQLDLSFCSIKSVTNSMFDKMKGLTNLNLKGNGIMKIQPESFQSLRFLRHIDLSINDLEQISSLVFYRNPELDVIRLNDNPKLTQLPTDGFLSHTGDFNVYLLDVSNCAIGALGYRTFSTMRHLTTLKLAWNNINNLDKGTFVYSDKLTELDLSNNLIVKLDDMIFLHNRDLTKLNLAGNPIKRLSAKLLQPLNNLRELDISECEIHTLLTDAYSVDVNSKFYETLHYFNASFNQIKKISKEDVKNFKNLKTLDISNNPLKCNEDFRDLMKYLGKRSIVSGKVPTIADAQDSFKIAVETAQTWDDLAKSICRHLSDNNDDNNDEYSYNAFKPKHEYQVANGDPTTTMRATTTTAATTERTTSSSTGNNMNKEDLDEDTSMSNEDDEDDEDMEDEDDEEYDSNNYDDEDDEDSEDDESKGKENENNKKNGNNNNDDEDENSSNENREINVNINKPIFKDKGLFAEEIDITKETEKKFLLNKLTDEDEDVIIERGTVYYSYRFLWPLVIILLSVVALLFIIGRIISLLVKRRGQRYREAILASKNTIVYQKLTEDGIYNISKERAPLV